MTRPLWHVTVVLFLLCHAAQAQSEAFVNFESPQARAMALSPKADVLFAVNTPACTLEVYSLKEPRRPALAAEIPVGLDPVSVAVRSEDEVWVVNHVSNAISIVKPSLGVVVATIRVGDRPSDVVFAGSPLRAFVTSMTRRTVSVIDLDQRTILQTIPLAGDAPRSLLTSADGQSVWVAVSRSGNQTTILPHTVAPAPPEPTNPKLPPAPRQGLIVRSDDPDWKRFKVPLADHDVIEIDSKELKVRRSYSGVGTILFNMTQRPSTTELWIANTEARNLIRFEPALRGHAIDSRITRITTGGDPTTTPIDLNPTIDYAKLPNANAKSTALAQPTDVVFAPSGKVGYLASFGTDRVGVIDPTGKVLNRIEIGNTQADKVDSRTKRGPRSLLHHPQEKLLYVLNRLSNSLTTIDTAEQKVLNETNLFDPTPVVIREGRGFLYDAKLSGNGTMSCAACHIDGDRDGLAWDLGDPNGELFKNGSATDLHPMKGPLLTQTLRGLKGERIFHWRADRPGLESFNGSFDTLLGGTKLKPDDLKLFVAFLKEIHFTANPNRNPDDTLPTSPPGESAQDGEKIFLTKKEVGREGLNQFRCVDCHTGERGSGAFGFTGLIEQPMKVAQLRGLFERDPKNHDLLDPVSGFAFGADGSKNRIADFLAKSHRFQGLTRSETVALERFLFAFPTETAPAVGQVRTITHTEVKTPALLEEIDSLMQQAQLGRCDLIVKGILDGQQVGFVLDCKTKRFLPDRSSAKPLTLTNLMTKLRQQNSFLTFLGVPPGSGLRLGIDRDNNRVLDGDE